ncbi:tRNA lysidine(34) synthetase TilS [Roseovarius sp. 217]|uniref:tRNA lysidine(34) synthetase TilS n=1 Tax=Roseovarius sp. (strain 217) TaxID=314264 RepID=UPI0000686F9B|nr:tRNA lysidine(34) synthetase TilS [Roseovarius sp. 217]EAQ23635.1 PP-loop family protein [Roseovarius sp. 217]
MTPPDARLRDRVAACFAGHPPPRLGVAVSGGSDSLALLHLLHDWQRAGGPALAAVTVDHGLRPEAGAEAAEVAHICARLNVPHHTLHWQGCGGSGNLPDRARRARYTLMSDWAAAQGLTDIAIGHTQDDLAETFLMRLARGAGVDGLAAMRPRWTQEGVTFHRPLLGLAREALRDHLRGLRQTWIDDPTNVDTSYLRPRAREILAALAPLGLDAATLAEVACNLSDARTALSHTTHAAARTLTRVEAGDLLIDHAGFANLPDEIARRLLHGALQWLTGAEYPPRGAALSALLAAARAGQTMTLQGGLLLPAKSGHLRLTREYDAVKDLRTPATALWDTRWQAIGPSDPADIEIAALGPAGLSACPDWRLSGLPHASALATPGLWQGDSLIAAPLMGWPNGWALTLRRDQDNLLMALLSH